MRANTLIVTARWVDALSTWTGRGIAWLTSAMVLVTFLVVILRYLFDLGWIWMQELTTWMHAVVFLIGAAYTLQSDEHVRVDVIYRRLAPPRRALVDVLGSLLLLLPTCVFIFWTAAPYVLNSWLRQEGSRETGGLPFPFVPVSKSAILLMVTLLVLQALAITLRGVLVLSGRLAPEAAGYAVETRQAHEL